MDMTDIDVPKNAYNVLGGCMYPDNWCYDCPNKEECEVNKNGV